MKAPFPWFGGKSKAADLIWSRFGADCGSYVEPFFGSGAVYLNRPGEFAGWATINDLDGNIANLWRAMKYAPEMVAASACDPVNECDLHARHLWLVNNHARLSARLMADPYYHEPEAAGWWAWGACSWIGGGWCAGDGPWRAEPDEQGVAALVLGTGGQGVNRKDWLVEWFAGLQLRIRDARITCGDWARIMSVGTMTRNGISAVLLDPPYSLTGAVYAHDSSSVSGDVRAWCVENGANQLLRIALCGHAGEGHEILEPLGWTVETWTKSGGYQGADDRERIWFSPGCIPAVPDQISLFD